MELVLKIWSLLKTLILLALVLASPLVGLPVLVLALALRSLVWGLARIFRPELGSFVGDAHAALALRNSTNAEINILCTAVVEGVVTKEQLRVSVQENLLDLKDPKTGESPYERLKYSWEAFMNFAFWRRDREFDLANHVRDYDHGGKLRLPSPCTREDYNKVLADLADAPWARKRSPWELLVVRDFEGLGEKTAVVMRISHALGDGYSILELVKRLTGSSFTVPEIKLAERELTLFERLGLVLKLPWDVASNAGKILGAKVIRHKGAGGDDGFVVSLSSCIPVETIKAIKNHYGVNYAAVVYAAIFGALEKALKESGQKVPGRLASGFVLPRTGHPPGLNIHATALMADWPMATATPQERLQRIQRNFKDMSKSSAALAYPYAVNLASYFPMFLRRIILELGTGAGASIAFSNFPVTTGPEFYNGQEILEATVTLGSLLSLGIIMITGGVNNKQAFSFTVKKNVFASEECGRKLGLYVEQELQALADSMV